MRRQALTGSVCAIAVAVAVAGATLAGAGATAEQTEPDPTAIRPFAVDVPDSVLDDLRERLARTRLPDQLEDVGWDYGAELGYVTDLITYWRDEFDWRAAERRLNAFDQYKTVIDGLDIHFIHQRSPEENALPLIITHGWPGSVAEFLKVIGPLTDPAAHGGDPADAFHVVAPSMPGYGFSDKPQEPGFGPEQTRGRQRQADGAARVRTLRNAGRRLGQHRQPVARLQAPGAGRGAAHQHGGGRASARR